MPNVISRCAGVLALVAVPAISVAQEASVPLVTAASDSADGSRAGARERGIYDEEGQGGDLYCRRKLGTWFYCDKPKAKPQSSTSQPVPTESADAQLKAIGRQLDELKARAILEPTEANVLAYVRFQREQLDRSSTFADVWQRALWQNPDVDYTLQRPVSTIGKRAWLDNRSAARTATMARLAQRYGVFYFYAQSCAACEIQSPILKSIADSNRLSVVAVSMDGGPNRVFPNYVVDSGQRERMGLPGKATPALVLFDTVTKRPIPIGTGLMAADEIMDRIFVLTNTKPGSDF
ncbi:MAG: conjugal transfer protein TraF [Xanthobacteraceae bacterium]|nr:conjugal transfer protein TraF [Xanthobacteraceae bacterium]